MYYQTKPLFLGAKKENYISLDNDQDSNRTTKKKVIENQ